METRKIDSVVTGHHVYKTVWTPFIGEILGTEQEQATNVHDRYAVSVMKKGKIVGHMPRTISKVSWHFLQHGGVINCEITGKRRKIRSSMSIQFCRNQKNSTKTFYN